MKLKEIYLNNQARRYSNITKIIKENVKLETNPLEKLKKNWIILLAILVIIVALLLIDFNPKYFSISLGLILVLLIIFIFGNKSSLICDKTALSVKQGFQKVNIPYDKLKNVYIGKVGGVLFFLPAITYNIIIRYEDNFSILRELEFSLLCADTEEVNNFINNFAIKEKTEERYIVYEKRKFVRRILGTILTVLIFIILLIYFFVESGINFGSII